MRDNRLRHLLLREARRVAVIWSLACAVGATVGGVLAVRDVLGWAEGE